MKRAQFKTVTSAFMKKLLNSWFPDMPFVKGLGISIVDANINKMDNLIELFEDENGDIDIQGIVHNLSDMTEPIRIDLTTISPLLPSRVLLITKDDFNDFLNYAYEEQNR